MGKTYEELIKDAHKLIAEHICWDEGCLAIFGDANITDVRTAIINKGAEKIIDKTTWSFDPDTKDGYDDWVEAKVKWETLPPELSKSAYLDAFRHQLTAMYLKAKLEQEKHNEKTNG